MSNEGDLNKRAMALRVPLKICRQITKKFSIASDRGNAPAFIRALEQAAKDIELTQEDWDAIKKEMAHNLEKRMKQRRAYHSLDSKSKRL